MTWFSRTHRRSRLWLAATVLVLTVTACGHAPVQEMSDARQALEAAQAAGAPEHASEQYREAQALLRSAESQLNQGRYREARQTAARARDEAIRAREIAQRAEQGRGSD
ncbi:MAG TPA: DUF4398 domain-containing protein [Gammaproteobacteria bacterium]|nr:DUF4398 domain-containing protein [Gammaproteobacteria bacterium]